MMLHIDIVTYPTRETSCINETRLQEALTTFKFYSNYVVLNDSRKCHVIVNKSFFVTNTLLTRYFVMSM